MTTWFTSDLHWGHKNILKYGRDRFFADLDEMREMMILNINSDVDPDDELYILGDVVMGIREENLPHIGRLNGYKTLILGNHDNNHPMYSHKANYDKNVELYGTYFHEMHEKLEIEVNGENVLLSHFPAEGDHTEDVRFLNWRPEYPDWIIHGHLHCEEIQVAPKHIHIGIDSIWEDYGIERWHPIPLEAIEQVMQEST